MQPLKTKFYHKIGKGEMRYCEFFLVEVDECPLRCFGFTSTGESANIDPKNFRNCMHLEKNRKS